MYVLQGTLCHPQIEMSLNQLIGKCRLCSKEIAGDQDAALKYATVYGCTARDASIYINFLVAASQVAMEPLQCYTIDA
jgi:hypothetical protein